MFIPFQENNTRNVSKLAIVSAVFHIVVVVSFVIGFVFKPEAEVKKIHVFEMVIPLNAPKPQARLAKPRPAPKPEPKKEKPRPVKKKEKKDPTPKKEPKKDPKPKVKPTPEPPDSLPPEMDLPPSPPAPASPSSDMDLPSFADASPLQTVGSVYVDPLLQVYLDRLVQILMSNFNPPSGLDIARGSKSRVQFTIQRGGRITGISLKNSSGNGTWDRLAVRALKVSKLPPLPPNYRAPMLPLIFDFKEQ